MNVAVFGGTGRTGRLVIEQALQAGHTVTALVRNPAKLTLQHPHLRVVQGQLTDAAQLAAVIAGQDAVISALGPTSNKPVQEISQAMTLIIAAMRDQRIDRLIVSAGAGVGDPMDQPKLIDRVIVTALKTFNGNVYADMLQVAQQVRQSGLEWTLVRAPRLTDDPPTGHIRAGGVGKDIGTQLTRGDFAAFLVRQLTDNTWLCKAPAISN